MPKRRPTPRLFFGRFHGPGTCHSWVVSPAAHPYIGSNPQTRRVLRRRSRARASGRLCSKSQRVPAAARKNPNYVEDARLRRVAYDRDLLRSLRIQAPRENPAIRDPKLLSLALAVLVPGLAMLAS